MKQGAFTFVLHSHLPYARQAGRWPHGEEWIHEAAVDTYLPLLSTLHDLAAEGIAYRLTIGITPVLAEQLADPDVLANLDDYLDGLRVRAARDIGRFEATGEPQRGAIAGYYRDRYAWLLGEFRDRFGRDLIGAFRWLQDNGFVELATSAATHGYLPLFERDSSIAGQLRTGIRAHRRHFGRDAESFWLPECAYRPRYTRDDGVHKPGIEEFLQAQGITTFFVESHTILGGVPVGKAAGDAVGPYGDVPRRYTMPSPHYPEAQARTTFLPYWVASPGVAAIGRNVRTGEQVWSASHGYPGDSAYREFHKKDGTSGLQYWRVTGADVELGDKALYDPKIAAGRAHEHARHFAGLVEEEVRAYAAAAGTPYGLVSAAYDTELFGHWWFEGVTWLKDVLRHLAASSIVDLTGAAQFVREHIPSESVALPEGSWGQQGTHFTWMNVDTAWMWPIITAAQIRTERIVQDHRDASPAALAQLARELVLLESSDWPFLVTTGQARAYAELRFSQHAERFDEVADAIESGHVNDARVAELWERDKIFADIDPQDFAQREGVASLQAAPLR